MAPLVALLLVLPGLAWAQGYQTYSHVESGLLYWGLGAQAIIRASSFRLVPYAVMTCCVIWLLYRRTYAVAPQPLSGVVVYLLHCVLILVLFWPEAMVRFLFGPASLPGVVVSVDEGAVFSYVARQNGEPNDDASTMRLAGVNLTPSGAPVPRALDLLLQIATEAPRRLGERINADMDRPLAHLGAMAALLTQPLTSDASRYALTEFTDGCYKDAVAKLTNDATATSGTTWQDRLPWSAEMARYMAKEVRLGPAGSVSDDLLGLSGVVTCGQIYTALEDTVTLDLTGEPTSGGSTKRKVYWEELGIPTRDSARFVITQELHKEMERAVQPPDLTDGSAMAAGAATGAATGAVQGASRGTWMGAMLGAVTGALTGAAATDEESDGLGFMSAALFLVQWMPYIAGLLSAVVLVFFPFVVLWALLPGQHVRPLAIYVLLLFFVHSTPLWWAIADALSSMAAHIDQPHAAGAIFASAGQAARRWETSATVGAMAIILVPVVQAVVMFGTWRAVSSSWRG